MIVCDQTERVGQWIADKTGMVFYNSGCTAIGFEINGEMKAGILYQNFTPKSVDVSWAVDYMSKEFLWYAFHYPLVELGLKKMIGEIDSANHKAVKLCEKLGFQKEAVIVDAGQIGDKIIYSITANQCRFI